MEHSTPLAGQDGPLEGFIEGSDSNTTRENEQSYAGATKDALPVKNYGSHANNGLPGNRQEIATDDEFDHPSEPDQVQTKAFVVDSNEVLPLPNEPSIDTMAQDMRSDNMEKLEVESSLDLEAPILEQLEGDLTSYNDYNHSLIHSGDLSNIREDEMHKFEGRPSIVWEMPEDEALGVRDWFMEDQQELTFVEEDMAVSCLSQDLEELNGRLAKDFSIDWDFGMSLDRSQEKNFADDCIYSAERDASVPDVWDNELAVNDNSTGTQPAQAKKDVISCKIFLQTPTSDMPHYSPHDYQEYIDEPFHESLDSTEEDKADNVLVFHASMEDDEWDSSLENQDDYDYSLAFEATISDDMWIEEDGLRNAEEISLVDPLAEFHGEAVEINVDGLFTGVGHDDSSSARTRKCAILVGDSTMESLEAGSVWKTTTRARSWLLDRLAYILNAIKYAQQNDILPLLKMLSRSRRAWSFDNGCRTMVLRAPAMAYKVVRGGTKRFEIYTKILECCKDLIESNVNATKRDIYYRDIGLFKSQRVVDLAIEDLACTFGVPRHCLNLVASSKGLVHGHLRLHMSDGSILDCLQGADQGCLIPTSEQVLHLETQAKFVLVIEKEATFRTLLAYRFAERHAPCILITGKGYPDVSTRRLVRRLSEIGAKTSHLPTSMDIEPVNDAEGIDWMPGSASVNEKVFHDMIFDEEKEHMFEFEEDREVTWLQRSGSFFEDVDGMLLREDSTVLQSSKDQECRSLGPLELDFMEAQEDNQLLLDSDATLALPFTNFDSMRQHRSGDYGFQEEDAYEDDAEIKHFEMGMEQPSHQLQLDETPNAATSKPIQSALCQIPMLALVDGDPHGWEIYLCYRMGSKAMAFDAANLACASLELLGLRPSDWSNPNFNIDFDKLLPLTERDRRKALRMLQRRYLRNMPDLRRELSRLLFYNKKAEIQAVEADVLVSTYLPSRISHWLSLC